MQIHVVFLTNSFTKCLICNRLVSNQSGLDEFSIFKGWKKSIVGLYLIHKASALLTYKASERPVWGFTQIRSC